MREKNEGSESDDKSSHSKVKTTPFPQPGDAGESPAQGMDLARQFLQFALTRLGGAAVRLTASGEQVPPSPRNFAVRPLAHDMGPVAEDQVKMFRHHAETNDVDGKNASQEFQPPLNPAFAMIVVLAADGVDAAQKSLTDTAVNAMVDTDGTFVDLVATVLTRHGAPPIWRPS